MIEYVGYDDLPYINQALNRGKDIRLQITPKGCRIIETSTRVLVKKEFDDNPIK